MFPSQVVLQNGLPFDVRLPNAATSTTTTELDPGRGGKSSATAGAAFRSILRKRKTSAKCNRSTFRAPSRKI
jgi:antitoxin component of RelBE/YafQ-DinJ toxin-antitoxin module